MTWRAGTTNSMQAWLMAQQVPSSRAPEQAHSTQTAPRLRTARQRAFAVARFYDTAASLILAIVLVGGDQTAMRHGATGYDAAERDAGAPDVVSALL